MEAHQYPKAFGDATQNQYLKSGRSSRFFGYTWNKIYYCYWEYFRLKSVYLTMFTMRYNPRYDNATLNSSRGTNSSRVTNFSDYAIEMPWTVTFGFQFFLAIIGNAMILWIVYKDNRLKTTTNFLVANMAVSDLLVALFGFSAMIFSTNFKDNQWSISVAITRSLCKIVPFIVDVGFTASVVSCAFIAIDRYYAVAKPLVKPFMNKMKFIISGIWISSIALSLPYLYFLDNIESSTLYCTVSSKNLLSYKLYRYFNLTVNTGLAVPFIVVWYALTVLKLYRHKAPCQLPNSTLKRREQQNRKVLKMAVTIVALLYLCYGNWMVYFILIVEGKFDNYSSTFRLNFGYASLFLLHLSLAYNFFIYLIFNHIYRENVKAIIFKCCCKLKQSNSIIRPSVPEPSVIELREVTLK